VLEVLRDRGHAHETAFANQLRASGRRVESGHDGDSLHALLREGVDVITQACLDHEAWSGRADFLIRVERPSALGPYSYEPYDTKLASETRLGAVLQLCVYADLLVHHQGIAPEYIHVVHPGNGFPTDSLRFAEYGAAYRALKKDLEVHVEEKRVPYPEPAAACGTCVWWRRCADRRRADDHLSLVAGLPRNHRRELESRGITSLTQLARESRPFSWRPDRGGIAPYELHGLQAELQVRARTETPPPFVRLPIENGRGLVRLPAPSSGDIFLDLEGDPFIGSRGREYLFGWVVQDAKGVWVYERRWALDDEAERAAFVEFVDFALARIGVHPDMHIYHFGPYEPSAFRRLKTAYAIRETEVAALQRDRRFVDLMAITRQSLRIGVESYGLKPIEALTGYRRELELDLAGPSIRAVRIALQRGEGELRDDWRHDVETYNRDDCVSTVALRDYLETIRTSSVSDGCDVPRPSPIEPEPIELTDARARIEVLRNGLVVGLPDPVDRDGLQRGRAVLADLLGWYGREARVVSADRHRLATLTEAERVDDPHAVGGLSFDERQPLAGRQRVPVDRYSFPLQELQIEEGETLWCSATQKFGQLVEVDFVAGTLAVRKAQESLEFHPSSCFVWQSVSTDEKEAALFRVAETIVASGFAPAHEPSLARDLLVAAVPRALVVGDQNLRNADEEPVACARRLAAGLDGTVLGIQGPPGSGKTTAAAEMIFDLLRAGRRVGICATSHKVIHNLVTRVTALAKTHRPRFRTMVKTDAATVLVEGAETTTDPKKIEALLPVVDLVAGTAWLWARPKMVGAVDTLFIDEAGQMSLADAVAISGAARNLVLIGDPQQLEQPSQAAHPDLVPASALQHLLGGRATLDPRHGLLLDESFRLHPSICTFTSEQFYEERLHSSAAAAQQGLRAAPLESPGLYVALVNHAGNQNRSEEEAELVAELISAILDGGSWSSPNTQDLPLTHQDMLVVAPYNAHVATLARTLESRGLGAVRVGTVDRFQGQEAPIAIYSMATSTQEDAPHGLAFLLSRHRLNVATSRARCAAIVVASSALSRPTSKTPNDLRLASAFCRFLELAQALELPPQRNTPTTRTS
jgi:predicted RecB family nuclease